ncbi:sulfurtransferase TusA family protein [Robertmurraya sp. Marseille-Q9965]
MKNIKANEVLDAKGLACPMPIVKTKKVMNNLEAGQVLEVQATDRGSKADMKAWAESTGHQFLGTIEDGEVLKHYLRKASSDESIEKKHPDVMKNEELEQRLGEDVTILDVRESAEFAFNHIPGAISIPLGELEERLGELSKAKNIYVICRTGNRSDLACQLLGKNGFSHVINVVPGMSQWTGKITGIES